MRSSRLNYLWFFQLAQTFAAEQLVQSKFILQLLSNMMIDDVFEIDGGHITL